MQEWVQAIKCCDAAFELDPSNIKVVLRRAKACSLNGDFEEARAVCQLLQDSTEGVPDDMKAEAITLLELNKKREAAALAKQRKGFTNFFAR